MFFGVQLSGNSLKIAFFQKKGAKIGFSIFLCFKFEILKFSFFGFLKHYKSRGFSKFFSFGLLKEKKVGKNMNTGISGFGFFWSKTGRFVTHIFFSK